MCEQQPAAENVIEIRIEKIAQLFHSLDPFPFHEKDLDSDAEEFIVGWARELPPDKPFRIVVHLPETQALTPEAHELGAAITQYFGYRARVISLDLNELFRVGRRSMSIGAAVRRPDNGRPVGRSVSSISQAFSNKRKRRLTRAWSAGWKAMPKWICQSASAVRFGSE
jgi:hypothetical protein